MWVSGELESAERCVILGKAGRATVRGTTLLPIGDAPAMVAYAVSTEGDWSTTTCKIRVSVEGRIQKIVLVRTNDGWTVNDDLRPDLSGCSTVDLGWTPATNTLALRAGQLSVGESHTATAAWVRFPDFDVVQSEQTYTRVTPDLVRYESANFSAELVVSPADVVTKYGDDIWRSIRIQQTG